MSDSNLVTRVVRLTPTEWALLTEQAELQQKGASDQHDLDAANALTRVVKALDLHHLDRLVAFLEAQENEALNAENNELATVLGRAIGTLTAPPAEVEATFDDLY